MSDFDKKKLSSKADKYVVHISNLKN